MDLGAPPVKTFFQITLPVIVPAIVSGWMLAFTLSLDDLVIASFTSGPGATTLPMKIYSQVRLGVTPEINAACTLLIAVVAVGVIAASIANKRREVQRHARRAGRAAGLGCSAAVARISHSRRRHRPVERGTGGDRRDERRAPGCRRRRRWLRRCAVVIGVRRAAWIAPGRTAPARRRHRERCRTAQIMRSPIWPRPSRSARRRSATRRLELGAVDRQRSRLATSRSGEEAALLGALEECRRGRGR